MTMDTDQLLLQYIATLMASFASRMDGEMISQTPVSRLAACRSATPARAVWVRATDRREARAAGASELVRVFRMAGHYAYQAWRSLAKKSWTIWLNRPSWTRMAMMSS